MTDKEFVDGLRVYRPNDNAPAFVKADVVITRKELGNWLRTKDTDEIRIQLLESQKGVWYFAVNQYDRGEKPTDPAPDDAHFDPDSDIPF